MMFALNGAEIIFNPSATVNGLSEGWFYIFLLKNENYYYWRASHEYMVS